MIRLATKFGRYGYRLVTTLFNPEGLRVNHKRVHRMLCKEGLKVPLKQPKRGRLKLENCSCVPDLNTEIMFDQMFFVAERMKNRRPIKKHTVIDGFARERSAIRVRRKIKSKNVIEVFGRLFLERGTLAHI